MPMAANTTIPSIANLLQWPTTDNQIMIIFTSDSDLEMCIRLEASSACGYASVALEAVCMGNGLFLANKGYGWLRMETQVKTTKTEMLVKISYPKNAHSRYCFRLCPWQFKAPYTQFRSNAENLTFKVLYLLTLALTIICLTQNPSNSWFIFHLSILSIGGGGHTNDVIIDDIL